MCGLFGIAGPGILQADLEVFKELGIISQLRGLDGAGIYQTKSNAYSSKYDHSIICKSEDTFAQLLVDIDYDKKKFSGLLSNVQVDVIIGHVRAATRGVISDENAHPFVFDNLVGAHNGTLKDKKYEHKEKTDSEMMFEDISKNGLLKVLSELHKDSAYAITMYDRISKKMYFTRNSKRTLHFALNDNRGVLYWASEPYFLKTILRRRNIEAHYFTLNEDQVWQLDPNKVISGTAFRNTKKAFFTIVKNNSEDKNKEEKHSDAPFDGGVKKEEVGSETKTTGSAVIVKFPVNNFKSFYNRCVCGSKTFNLVEGHRCKLGKLVGYSYDPTNDSYYCDNCVKETQHAVH